MRTSMSLSSRLVTRYDGNNCNASYRISRKSIYLVCSVIFTRQDVDGCCARGTPLQLCSNRLLSTSIIFAKDTRALSHHPAASIDSSLVLRHCVGEISPFKQQFRGPTLLFLRRTSFQQKQAGKAVSVSSRVVSFSTIAGCVLCPMLVPLPVPPPLNNAICWTCGFGKRTCARTTPRLR